MSGSGPVSPAICQMPSSGLPTGSFLWCVFVTAKGWLLCSVFELQRVLCTGDSSWWGQQPPNTFSLTNGRLSWCCVFLRTVGYCMRGGCIFDYTCLPYCVCGLWSQYRGMAFLKPYVECYLHCYLRFFVSCIEQLSDFSRKDQMHLWQYPLQQNRRTLPDHRDSFCSCRYLARFFQCCYS